LTNDFSSDRYGFGYQLSKDSVGVSFNDVTRMVILPDVAIGTRQGEISSGTLEVTALKIP